MESSKRIRVVVAGVFCCLLVVFIAGCAVGMSGKAQAKKMAVETADPVVEPAAKPVAKSAAKKVPTGADLYKVDPIPLTAVQCGQCHTTHFQYLKQDGLNHRFECQNCHEKFHAYNPIKKNWAELMPKCEQCHTTPPHGSKFAACLSCHENPHTPRKIAMSEKLTPHCGQCHTSPEGQLKKFPSAHTQQACDSCHHDKHGYIPSCMECHDPHLPDQPVEACLACHPVHKPLEIALSAGSSTETCSVCHDGVYGKWTATASKHRMVACGQCHRAHGKIPKCSMCHGTPHPAPLLARFPRCLDCHLDVHNLPVKK